jgi:hypothetical protein
MARCIRVLCLTLALILCCLAQEYRLNHNRYDLVLYLESNGTVSYTNGSSLQYFSFLMGNNITYIDATIRCSYTINIAVNSAWCRVLLMNEYNVGLYRNGSPYKALYITDYVNATKKVGSLEYSYDPTDDPSLSNAQWITGNMYSITEVFSSSTGPVIATSSDITFDNNYEILVLNDNGGSVALNTFWVILLFLGGFLLCVGCTVCVMVCVMCIVITGRISYFDRDINWSALFNKTESEIEYDNLAQNQL